MKKEQEEEELGKQDQIIINLFLFIESGINRIYKIWLFVFIFNFMINLYNYIYKFIKETILQFVNKYIYIN
jgi:hypothetical protein